MNSTPTMLGGGIKTDKTITKVEEELCEWREGEGVGWWKRVERSFTLLRRQKKTREIIQLRYDEGLIPLRS